MPTAILSFADPGQVRLRCRGAGIDEARPLDPSPPFVAWASEYAAAQHLPTGEIRRLELERPKDVELAWRDAPEEVRLIELGREIGRWLDAEQGWLARLLKAASEVRAPIPEPLIFEIETSAEPTALEQAALDAPWELIATAERGHLALDPSVRLSPVRRLDVPGTERSPSRCRLSVLFMAAQPRDVTVLDFEREEAAIAARVGEIDPDMLDLFVEESGMLEGLEAAAQRAAECTIAGGEGYAGPVDVIHISCHGRGGARPALLLEDEVGDLAEATAEDLVARLGAHVPALAFVSACSTADVSAAGRSLAAELCMRGWPAVLGWSGPVLDGEATWLAARLYRGLAQRMPLAEALAPCRLETREPGRAPRKVWHQARLFVGRGGGDRIDGGAAARRPARTEQRQYLDHLGRVPVARDDEFVGRRRALQRVLASLRSEDLVGAVIHGAGQLGKSSLAARVSHRRHDLQTVVVYKHYDAGAILAAIAAEVKGADEIIARHRPEGAWDAPAFSRALRELLEGLCRAANAGAILLVIDDFEQVLEPPRASETHAKVGAKWGPTIGALISAFAGARTRSRLLFTSRHRFIAADVQGLDLSLALWHEPLGAMPRDDLEKRLRASGSDHASRAAAIELCCGNPGLLKLLLTIMDRAPATWPTVHAELRAYAEQGAPVTQRDLAEFMARVALDHLIAGLAPNERDLLRLLTAFETHVPTAVAATLGILAGIDEPDRAAAAIERMITLGLLDLALSHSTRPGAHGATRPDEGEVAVNLLAVPPTLAATRPIPDDEMAQVARASLRPLRAAWDFAVRSRALRECRELTRLAQLAADTSTLAEVIGRVASAVARTDARGLTEMVLAVEASEALWPDEEELRAMSHVCRVVGRFEATQRLLSRGLALEELAPDARARLQAELAECRMERGEPGEALRILKEEVLPVFERLGDVESKATTQWKIASILYVHGELDEALRILQEEVLPVNEQLGDVQVKAMTLAKIADMLYLREDFDEALRILKEQVLPVYEQFGGMHGLHDKAVVLAQIADILYMRRDLDEALRVRREEVLPIYEQLDEPHGKAMTRGKIAEILCLRGELDEALRILYVVRSDFERLGDLRHTTVAHARISDVLRAQEKHDEALRILKEEVLPGFERLGDVRSLSIGLVNCAEALLAEPTGARLVEARERLRRVAVIAERQGSTFPGSLHSHLARLRARLTELIGDRIFGVHTP